jgi:hypothetical protein
MNERKIIYIDVGKMTEKECCDLLGIEYIPWYKSSLFWGLFLVFAMPSILLLLGTLK